MTSFFDERTWRSAQLAVQQAAVFQEHAQTVAEFSRAMNVNIEGVQELLRLEAIRFVPDLAAQQQMLDAISSSSVMNVAQVVEAMQAFNTVSLFHGLNAYLERLRSDLAREPDTREVFEYPETDLAVPEVRESILVYAPSILLLEELRAGHMSLHDLDWRQFEEIIAELLRRDGHEVHLGRGTKDDGKDIVAFKHVPGIGLIMSIWQAKKLQSHNRVGLDTIKVLADTRLTTGANKGVIVTTTSLTKGALDRIQRDCYLLHKVDGSDLDAWIHEGRRP